MPDQEELAEKHTRIARRFITAADRYLAEGDLVQASEKLWGAAAHATKVYCISRGWRHGKYSHLKRAMRSMTEETGDDSWADGFKVAYELHLNFYSDTMRVAVLDFNRLIVRDLETISKFDTTLTVIPAKAGISWGAILELMDTSPVGPEPVEGPSVCGSTSSPCTDSRLVHQFKDVVLLGCKSLYGLFQ